MPLTLMPGHASGLGNGASSYGSFGFPDAPRD